MDGREPFLDLQSHRARPDRVAVHFPRLGGPMYAHEKVTLSVVAEGIARLKDCDFIGCYDRARHASKGHASAGLYFVPSDTMIADEAQQLGMTSARSVFGGVVPYPFVKTKAITHPLVSDIAERPTGWSSGFAIATRDSVLPGYTAFSAPDARAAAGRLLTHGAIRLKEPLADSGCGQTVVTTVRELDACLERYPADAMAAHGVVLETNLLRAVTRSVGQITIDDESIAYHGTQRTVMNNAGRPVYGGSRITCARGGWESLDGLAMEAESRLAVAQARRYDRAASVYAGFMASRRNYDVGQGVDGKGEWRSGVLEASWRSGGASTAELAALNELARDPALQVVEASAVKEFGREPAAPSGAVTHFQGEDPEDGPILRYTTVMRALRRAA